MEIPSLTDFLRLERKVDDLSSLITNFNLSKSQAAEKSLIMNVAEVEKEFKQSPYHQRIARNTGKLKFMPSGRDIQYNRADVEEWIKTKIVI